MMERIMLKSKIHRAIATGADNSHEFCGRS